MSVSVESFGDDYAAVAACVDAVIREEALTIVVQPIVEVHSGTILGYEALSRFTGQPLQGPALWFEDAERVGRRTELERLALRLALTVLRALPQDCFLSVNASPATVLSGKPQLDLLTTLCVSLGQGFLLGRPGAPPGSTPQERPDRGGRSVSHPQTTRATDLP
jgi:EAL domain-containing protein (putative c-di-GMP-specific phosphodiesterase class I)